MIHLNVRVNVPLRGVTIKISYIYIYVCIYIIFQIEWYSIYVAV